MGKTENPREVPERVRAARARVEAMIRERGLKPVNWDEMMKHAWPENDPNDEFLKLLREWRGEG